MGGPEVADGVKILNDAGIPTFETPEQAVDTFMEMHTYSERRELLQQTPPRLPRELQVSTRTARTFIDHCLERQATILTELESKAILSAYGIPVNRTVAASSAPDAAKAAAVIGFPVVMKINSPDITHKADVGGVRLHIHNEAEVLAAFHEIIEDARAQQPEARVLGVTVQEQEKAADCELLIGSKRDPDFGPLILVGAGGALTEVFQDVAVDLPPLNLLLARRLIEKTRDFQGPPGLSQPAAGQPGPAERNPGAGLPVGDGFSRNYRAGHQPPVGHQRPLRGAGCPPGGGTQPGAGAPAPDHRPVPQPIRERLDDAGRHPGAAAPHEAGR